MAIRSRSHKPNEWAAKINHTHIINDPFVKNFIGECSFPKELAKIQKGDSQHFKIPDNSTANSIRHVIAVDGGYTTVEVRKNFPSSQFAFFQFGSVLLDLEDLESLSEKPFIFPEDMQKLHNIERFKLAIPIKNIVMRTEFSLKNSIRKAIYDFFMKQRDGSTFMETLEWLIFERYKNSSSDTYLLASNPNLEVGSGRFELDRACMDQNYMFDSLHGKVYLTDVFRLHEVVDEEYGAAGLLGYLTRLIEQIILVHFVRLIYRYQKKLLNEFLFITDGPLSFSGPTANIHNSMRELCNWLKHDTDLFLVGLEKSGPFVDHAREIAFPSKGDPILENGEYFILSNEYIYKYIVAGDSSRMHYGSYSYYGGKVIFHSEHDQVLVLTVPVRDKDSVLNPKKEDYANLEEVLISIQKLKCDMYDDTTVPIAFANKLVSLANHPSKVLLEKFAISALNTADH